MDRGRSGRGPSAEARWRRRPRCRCAAACRTRPGGRRVPSVRRGPGPWAGCGTDEDRSRRHVRDRAELAGSGAGAVGPRRRRHPGLALRLNLDQLQHTVADRHLDPVDGRHLDAVAGLHRRGAPDLQAPAAELVHAPPAGPSGGARQREGPVALESSGGLWRGGSLPAASAGRAGAERFATGARLATSSARSSSAVSGPIADARGTHGGDLSTARGRAGDVAASQGRSTARSPPAGQERRSAVHIGSSQTDGDDPPEPRRHRIGATVRACRW